MSDDRETLAAFLIAEGLADEKQGYGHATGEEVADAILASQWLADRDAKVRAEVGERIAVELERLRITNPMNHDGSNYMLDKVIARLDVLAGDDGPSTAAEWERARRADAEDKRYCEMHDQPLPTQSHVERLAARIARTTDTTSEEGA